MTNDERRRSLLRPPQRRRVIGSLALGLAAGLVAWTFGVDVAHAVGIGAVLAAFVLCLSFVGDLPGVQWAPPGPGVRDGPRRDVAQLGWALHARGGLVAPEAVRRLRAVTAQVVDLHGLDLDDPAHRPAIERALGAELLKLVRRGTADTPKLSTYQAALAALDRLADAPPGPFTLDGVADAAASATAASAIATPHEEITDAH